MYDKWYNLGKENECGQTNDTIPVPFLYAVKINTFHLKWPECDIVQHSNNNMSHNVELMQVTSSNQTWINNMYQLCEIEGEHICL